MTTRPTRPTHPRPMLSRRRFVAGVSAAAGAAILAACGTDTPVAPTAGAPTTGAPTTGAASVASPTVAAAAAPTTMTTTTTGMTAPTAPAMLPTVNQPFATSAAAPVGAVSSIAAPTAGASVPKGGAITQAVTSDGKSFHPYQTNDTASSSLWGHVYGGGSLTKYNDDTLETVGFAAEKWEISPDKKTYTFTLRDGLKWSDGAPFTTDDYVWTFQQALKPENKYPYVENLKVIQSYTAKDPRTLIVTLNEALVVGLENSDVVTPLPRHTWEKYDWNDSTKNPEINAPSVANGSYKLKEWKRDDHATFVANDNYWEGRPNLDSFTMRVFGTQALAYQALKSGEVDWASFQPSDYADAKKQPNLNVYEYYTAASSWQYIGYNLRRPALKDALVRKALAYATDRQGIIDGVAFGLGRPIYSAFPQSSWVYNPNVEHYDFNLGKARDLLTQAGYTMSGKNLTKDGKQLSLKLLYGPATSKVREGIATVMQQQLGDLGIKVDVQPLEFQSYLNTLQTEPFDYDLFVLGWAATIEPHFSYQIWYESSIPQLNSGAYVNKQVEMLFDQGSKEFDRAKRKAIYGDIQRVISDDEPYIFLHESESYVGINKRVGGILPKKTGITYNLEKWYVTK